MFLTLFNSSSRFNQARIKLRLTLSPPLLAKNITSRIWIAVQPVSYTHLDVYKRQIFSRMWQNYQTSVQWKVAKEV